MGETTEKTDVSLRLAMLFNETKEVFEKYSSGILNRQRKNAFQEYISRGIPTRRNENYKYSNLQPAFNADYKWVMKDVATDGKFPEIPSDAIPTAVKFSFFVHNGMVREILTSDLPKGVIIRKLSEASVDHPEKVSSYYAGLTTASEDPMVALNTAFAREGFFISIPDNTIVEQPVGIVNYVSPGVDSSIILRNLVVVGKNSSLKLFVWDISEGDKKILGNSATEIFCEENTEFQLINFQKLTDNSSLVNSFLIQQKRDSRAKAHFVPLNGGLIRNNLKVTLAGENCEAGLFGLSLPKQKQHVDNFVEVIHEAPHCQSNQLFKNVLDDSSVGAFAGKIHVVRDAQKTNAFQRNNNLVLTDKAVMNTKPQLIIDADDVKCSHGATVGQLDEEAMFYLRARGINSQLARQMMINAFAHEVIREIGDEQVQNFLIEQIEKKLATVPQE